MKIKTFRSYLNLAISLFFFLLLITTPCSSASSGWPSPPPPQENTFDFIIVGGGNAGLVVARRLAEAGNGKFSVLVLESGDEPKKGSEVPAYAPKGLSDPDVLFKYQTVPQKNAGLLHGGHVSLVSGRMLSGTSNLNFMVYNRGHSKDYDNWGELTQDSSWNYSNMLKYFKRVETYDGDHPSDQHGYSGPITISRPRYCPGLRYWLGAGKSLGYQNDLDSNGPQTIGFSADEFTKKRGKRVNSFSGYIEPILTSTPNLKIVTNTNATRILFKNNRAIGIRFQSTSPLLQNTPDNCVYARKEVILSAGTYGSPLLLLRSGVGPKDSLLEANIHLVKELPVGRGLQDHVVVRLPFVINNQHQILDYDRDMNPTNWEIYEQTGDGPYSNSGGVSGQAFLTSSVAKAEGEGDWADLHLNMVNCKQTYFSTGLVGNGSVHDWEGPIAASVFLTRVNSRGSGLRLDPKDPEGPPLIDPGYLSDPRDMQRMVDGITELLKIFEETTAYKALGARLPRLNVPQCDGLEYRSKEFWECVVRYFSKSGCHPAGTNCMGVEGGANAVVDTKLRVIGIDGLRVVDASIMPVVINSNTQAAVYGIAEKASDMILSDWD